MTLLLIYLVIAIGVSFLCSVLEAVLLSITPGYVQNISSNSLGSGKALVRVRERLDESISSIHTSQKQTLDYLCIQPEEIREAYMKLAY